MRWFGYFRFVGLFLLCALPVVGWSQSVKWNPAQGNLQQGVTNRLNLEFLGCQPENGVNLPVVKGLSFGTPSVSTRFQLINTTMTRSAQYSYPVRATGTGEVVIPAFDVETNQGKITVPEARYQMVKASVSPITRPTPMGASPSSGAHNSGELTVDDVAQAKIEYEHDEVWEGEVLRAKVVFQGLSRYVRDLNELNWEPSQLRVGPWMKHTQKRGEVRGQSAILVEIPTEVQVPMKAGELQADAGELTLTVSSPPSRQSVFGGLFQQLTGGRQVTIQAEAPPLHVKALPPAENGFSGAVGEFTFTSKLVTKNVAIGEPVTWTVELSGTGNWSDTIQLPDRQVPEGFEVIQPKSKTQMDPDSPFTGKMTEDVVLIPTRSGTFKIPGVEFTYFDTKTGSYRTLKTSPETVVVEPGGKRSVSDQNQSNRSTQADGTPVTGLARPQVAPFDMQAQLPRDPLGHASSSMRPWGIAAWFFWLLIPWLGVLLFWVWKAWTRVVRLDPGRSRRTALKALKEWNRSVAGGVPSRTDLREWQRQVGKLWQVNRPVPYLSRFQEVVELQGGDRQEWGWLWNRCEQVLFGEGEKLPEDWVERSEKAVAAVILPRVRMSGFFNPQVWLPIVVFILLLEPVLAAGGGDQEVLPDATQSYQSGEYQKTEAVLRQRLDDNWRDWVAHHDLALSLFQQERWDEAAAHASIAALQAPGNAAVLWDVRLLLDRAGWTATEPGRLFESQSAWNGLAHLFPVSLWQWWGLGFSLLLALVIAWGMIVKYHPSRSGAAGRILRYLLGLLALLGWICAMACVEHWGVLKDPRAVIVVEEVQARSIPSEVDQQTRPLPVGTVGTFRKQFLGWRQLILANRETVWVREQDVLPVYEK